jgi:hypothetical protein
MTTTLRPGGKVCASAFADYVAEIREDEDVLSALDDQLDELQGRLGSQRRGMAGDGSITVRAFAYVSAGHTRHHLRALEAGYLG